MLEHPRPARLGAGVNTETGKATTFWAAECKQPDLAKAMKGRMEAGAILIQ
jgi:hypothetical protein